MPFVVHVCSCMHMHMHTLAVWMTDHNSRIFIKFCFCAIEVGGCAKNRKKKEVVKFLCCTLYASYQFNKPVFQCSRASCLTICSLLFFLCLVFLGPIAITIFIWHHKNSAQLSREVEHRSSNSVSVKAPPARGSFSPRFCSMIVMMDGGILRERNCFPRKDFKQIPQ